MEKVIVYYNRESDTLDVWFGNPKDEYSCEEVGEDVILKKDKEGHVIGFEKLYLHLTQSSLTQPLPFELVVA